MTAIATTEPDMTSTDRLLILITVGTATMLYGVSMTIVNVALPQLQGAMSATQDEVSWVVTLNIIATAIATPLTGWFVARIGRRALLLYSILGFSIATLLCGSAESLEALLIYRIFQGALGAPLVPLAQAIVLDTYPRAQHAFANGILGVSAVFGPAIAPSIGGYLAEVFDWRWVFYMIVPLCVFALLGALRFIHDLEREQTLRFNLSGFLLFSVVLASIQLIIDRGEQLDWFDSYIIIGLFVILLIALYGFLVNSYYSEHPFINPSLFTNANYVVGLIIVAVYGMLNFTPLVVLPPLLQNAKGYPDSLIGTILAMRGVGLIIGFYTASKMGRFDPRIGMSVGLGCMGVSGWALGQLGLDFAPWHVSWPSIIQGVGCGLMWTPLSVVTFSTLPTKLFPDGSALFHLIRNFGSSLFIAISIITLTRTAKIHYAESSSSISPLNEMLRLDSITGLWSFQTSPGVAALQNEFFRQSTMVGYDNAFLLYALVCLVTAPFLFFVRYKRERSR